MKQRVFAWVLVLVLALTPVLAIAEGDETEPPAASEPAETEEPSAPPTGQPSEEPSEQPTAPPSEGPSEQPTEQPSEEPSESPEPSEQPSASPSAKPTESPEPSEDPAEDASDPLRIDTSWMYPGMDKSYAGGYMPVQTDGSVQFMMPLLGKTQGNTIRVVPEFPSDGPFAPTNLQFDVYEKSYDVTQGKDNKTGKMDAYLIQFSVPLKSTYYNGTYTVTLHVTYKTPAGDPTEQTFTLQVQITGGKTPSSGGGGGGPTAVRKPVILIQNCMITPTEVSGGERASVSVSMSNVGNYDAKNIRVSLIPESDTVTLRGDLNAKFFDALPIKGELDADFDLAIAPGATEGAAIVTVQITYEDKYGGAYTEEGKYTIHITQPKIEIVDCEYSDVVNGGDGFTVTLTVKNSGTRDAKNVVVQYISEDDSIRYTGIQDHQTIESLKKGESTTVTFDLRALPSAMEGKHSFRFSCSYKDAANSGSYENGTDYPLTVVQKASLGYDEVRLPESITSGESFTLPVCVYNTGFSQIFNVRCSLNCDGLISSSAFLGNLAPQESADKVMTVFVTTLSGSQKYGEAYGNIEITYEDVNGEKQTEYQSVKMTITEPVKITDEEKEREKQKVEEQQTLSQWWISLLVAIAIIIILIAVILIARFARILRMK